jgi:hypothetical protein
MSKKACLNCQNFSSNGKIVTNVTVYNGEKKSDDKVMLSEDNEICLHKNISLNNLKPVYCNSFRTIDNKKVFEELSHTEISKYSN